MDYLSTKQVSEKWSVSVRRILKLCEDGRIKGAIKIAGVWLPPEAVEKPTDARIKSGKYIKEK